MGVPLYAFPGLTPLREVLRIKLAEGHRDTALCIANLPCTSEGGSEEAKGARPFLLLASVLPPGFAARTKLEEVCPDECAILSLFQICLYRDPDGKLRWQVAEAGGRAPCPSVVFSLSPVTLLPGSREWWRGPTMGCACLGYKSTTRAGRPRQLQRPICDVSRRGRVWTDILARCQQGAPSCSSSSASPLLLPGGAAGQAGPPAGACLWLAVATPPPPPRVPKGGHQRQDEEMVGGDAAPQYGHGGICGLQELGSQRST
eukprot:jgi/Botrbrau1/20127/Bobra.0173s0029.1